MTRAACIPHDHTFRSVRPHYRPVIPAPLVIPATPPLSFRASGNPVLAASQPGRQHWRLENDNFCGSIRPFFRSLTNTTHWPHYGVIMQIALNALRQSSIFCFLMVGIAATSVQYVAYFIGLTVFDTAVVAVSSAAYLLGSVVSYCLNYRWTFDSDKAHSESLLRFYVMVFISFILNAVLMYVLSYAINWPPWPAQFAATAIVFMFNFLVSRLWVF